MYDLGSQREDVPFLPLLIGLAAWPLCRVAADRFVRWYRPDFYQHLKSEYERRYLFFFGLLMGLFVKPPSVLACGLSAWNTAPEDDIAGFRRPMNPYQQLCWGSRAVIYVSELPHYLHLPEMVLHHFLSLFGMAIIARYHAPRRGYDLSLAALFSEATNNLRSLLKLTRYSRKHPNLDWYLQFYGTTSMYLTRVPAIVMGLAMIPASGIQAGPAGITVIAYLFYLGYVHRITYQRLRYSDILQIEDSGVFRVRIGDQLNITSTSLLTGLAILGTQISVVALYTSTRTQPVPATTEELINLVWISMFAVAVGLAASRLVAPLLQRILQWRNMSSVYLQSGLASAIVFLCLSPTLDTIIHKETLVASLLLSSSLTKAISQYAAHLACMESDSRAIAIQDDTDSTETKSEQRVPSRASLFCSVLNLFQYLVSVLTVTTGYFSLSEAAFGTLLVQFVIRAAVNSTLEQSGNTILTLGSLAMLKTLWTLGGIVTSPVYPHELDGNYTMEDALPATQPSLLIDWQVTLKSALTDLIVLGGLYFLVSAATNCFSTSRYSSKIGFPRLRTLAFISIVAWFGCVSYAAALGEYPEIYNKGLTAAEIVARQPPICSLLLSWQFWVVTATSVSVPTAAAHLWLPKTASQAKEIKSDSFWDQE